jgi:hypothetical protein
VAKPADEGLQRCRTTTTYGRYLAQDIVNMETGEI